ncbi:MAG: hypothetical protein Q8W45_11270, partial [Candidatus Palauibacterales bacterium]|nr:hypothetical protein [Candidatus Palauibacterales bacterium]
GTSFSGTAYYCGSNMPATRLTGRAGIWIDAISLGCSWMFPGTFALASPTDNTRLTTTTPIFTWGASSGATSATIDLTQVGSSSTGSSFSVPPATTSYRWPAGQWPFASGASILWRVRACNANACREVVRHLIAP